MSNKIKQELNEMKYLFGYERGRVISEQKEVPMEEDMDFDVMNDEDIEVLDNVGYEDDEIDFDVESNREIETPVRPDVDTPTKPKNPDTPYSPKPGPKKNPKAKNKNPKAKNNRRMPSWLSFNELGIDMSEN